MPIIIFILILSFLIIIHELGHLMAAKWAKIKVEEFGIGYPPRAFKLFTKGKVLFSLNWIPVGGFVKMKGENGPEDNDQDEDEDGLAPFYKRSRFKRLVVILAGVTCNIIFGIIAFAIIFTKQGIPTQIDTPRIGFIAPNSPASEIGIIENTEIKSLQFEEEALEIASVDQVIEFINGHKGKEIAITTTLECNGLTCPTETKSFTTYLRTDEETPTNEGSLGIGFTDYTHIFYPWYEMPFRGVWFGLKQAIMMSLMIVVALASLITQLFQGSIPQDVAGPVGIVDHAAQSGIFGEGWLSILNFSAIISINLAVMNFLPIPALDGGRAFFILLEKFFGKKRIAKIEGYANYGGMILLLLFITLVTIRDVSRIIGR
jgi:regulator of sigma E protease